MYLDKIARRLEWAEQVVRSNPLRNVYTNISTSRVGQEPSGRPKTRWIDKSQQIFFKAACIKLKTETPQDGQTWRRVFLADKDEQSLCIPPLKKSYFIYLILAIKRIIISQEYLIHNILISRKYFQNYHL